MLKKVVAIRNVGKFRNCGTSGDVQFRRATLVFAPNARGKTTLCDILRSLRTGDSSYIIGRQTLGTSDAPEVEVLTEGGKCDFKSGAWTDTVGNLEVYDSRFVNDNVHAGECVGHDQRRNLYDVILGEEGRDLKNDCDASDAAGREAVREEKEKQAALQRLIPNGMALEKFLSLEKGDDFDAKLVEAKRRVALLESSSEVRRKSLLSTVALPAFPDGLAKVLESTLENVSENAEALIQSHVEKHLKSADEAWLHKGVSLMVDDGCPFCGTTLSGQELLAAYRTHFAGSYRRHKESVDAWRDKVESFVGEATFLRMQQTVEGNSRLLGEWQTYITTEEKLNLDVESVGKSCLALQEVARGAVAKKCEALLEPVDVAQELTAAEEQVAQARAAVLDYNKAVERVNAAMRAKQEESRKGGLAEAKQDLGELEATSVRVGEEATTACKELLVARTKRAAADVEKLKAKQNLEEYSESVFQRYEKRINEYLKRFGTSFRVRKTAAEFPGGKPRTTYCLAIEAHEGSWEEVKLGDLKTPNDQASFKNTLSAGDKSALALAFFFAQVEASPNLADKVVVLDDPFTSQDRARRVCTQQSIRKLTKKTRQVVVLSHDPNFLKLIWDELPAADKKTLQLTELGGVMEWDIESAVLEEYYQNFTTLWKYCEYREGRPESVVKTMRVLLEKYLRWKLPNQFDAKGWLGDYVKAIADAEEGTPLAHAKCILEELEDLKDYAKRYHHPQDDGAASGELVDADELAAYGMRALELVQKF